jgi:hypothetical protein
MTEYDDVAALRMYLGEGNEGWADDELARVILEAKRRIGGRRWSWKVVASDILRTPRTQQRPTRRRGADGLPMCPVRP